jgi:hypothetical protein
MRILGRTRRGLLDNINLDLAEIEWRSVNWNGLAQDKEIWRVLVNEVKNFRFP